jgi:hypothetical protein
LRRRLFERIDHAAAARVIEQYRALWQANRECLSPEASDPATLANFRASYPLHLDVLHTFSIKTNTIAEFQRVRGMLRLLGRTIARLWDRRPSDATAIHLHHIDPGFEPIRQEIVTRMGQTMYSSAILSDVASETGKRALAEEQDEVHHQGFPPYAAYVARTVLMHSLAHNVPLRGCTSEHLRYDILRPRLDISFIEAARQRFVSESAFLDDTPGVPMRFQTQANLTQVIRREQDNVDAGEIRSELNHRIRKVFEGPLFEQVFFPGGPWDVPDEIGRGRPFLVVLSYDGCSVGTSVDAIPDLIARIWERKGSDGGTLRVLRNNLVFIAAEEGRVEDMRSKSRGVSPSLH